MRESNGYFWWLVARVHLLVVISSIPLMEEMESQITICFGYFYGQFANVLILALSKK